MSSRILLALFVPAALAAPALAQAPTEHPAECRVAEAQVEKAFPLSRAARAVAAKRLDILVLGAGSSALPGPEGQNRAYPARLKETLAAALPGVAVTVATDVKSARTAEAMLLSLPQDLAKSKPALMIWQTGTVDAMQGADPDRFGQALDKGVRLAQSAGADVVLMNAQYSPRTESMINLATYSEAMRWVALQHEIPLFDRFAVMKTWADLGVFDFNIATKKLDMAERVHDCIGRLLADLVLEAARSERSQAEGGR
jgi:lysophospholipase L1-like esterase